MTGPELKAIDGGGEPPDDPLVNEIALERVRHDGRVRVVYAVGGQVWHLLMVASIVLLAANTVGELAALVAFAVLAILSVALTKGGNA
jgi:hypothetical protein